LLGAEYVRYFSRWIELGGGAGIGLSALDGPGSFPRVLQWSLMPRLRLGGERNAFTVGMGASVGGYAQLALPCEGAADCYDARATVVWRNAEIGGEHLRPSGFALRYFVGIGDPMLTWDWRCKIACSVYPLLYFGLALGGAL
jgi:hypothetical protein